jgi:replicative DNA helicase
MPEQQRLHSVSFYLDELQQKVYQARKSLLENNKPITADAIKSILTGKH